MRRLLPIATLSILAACSSPDVKPAGDVGPSPDAASNDGAPDAGGADVSTPVPDGGTVAGDSGPTDPFEFDFEPRALDFELSGVHTATARFDTAESVGDFVIVAGQSRVDGTLNVARPGGDHTHRFWGEADYFAGTLDLVLTAGACEDCEPLPDEVRSAGRYEVRAAYDGERVVFSPFRLIEGAAEFEEPTPTDLVLVPNDGFKPAMVPEAVGTWTGLVSSSDDSTVFGGTRTCSVTIEQPAADFVLTDMTCGDATYVLDANPGPVSGSLLVDDGADLAVEFDFLDGDATYRFAATIGQDQLLGVIVDDAAADAPFEAPPEDVVGVFVLNREL